MAAKKSALNSMHKNYPAWVCQACGEKASGGKQFTVSTWHLGVCGVCGKTRCVTEPRDFYYPTFIKGKKVHMPSRIVPEFKKLLKKDGGLYISWQANIAMAFYDEAQRNKAKISKQLLHKVSNQAAKNFLDMLLK